MASQISAHSLMQIRGIGAVTTNRMVKRKQFLTNRGYQLENELLSEADRKHLEQNYKILQGKLAALKSNLQLSKNNFENTKEEIAVKYRDGETIAVKLAYILGSITEFEGPSGRHEEALRGLAKVQPGELSGKFIRWP